MLPSEFVYKCKCGGKCSGKAYHGKAKCHFNVQNCEHGIFHILLLKWLRLTVIS